MSNPYSAWLKWALVFGLIPGGGGGGGGTFDPGQIFFVQQGAGMGGNGSIAQPFGSISQAYAAGVTSAAPFIVAVMPGTYDESASPLAFVPYGSIMGFDQASTDVRLGVLTFDQTAWALDPGVVGRIGIYGMQLLATSLDFIVPTSSDGNIVMRDVSLRLIGEATAVFQNFQFFCDFADCNFLQTKMHFYGSFVKSPGCYWGTVVSSTFNVTTTTAIANGRFEVSQRIQSLSLKAADFNTQTAYINLVDPSALVTFDSNGVGSDITIYKSASVSAPTISGGTPIIENVDLAENVYANIDRTNYTPTSATAEGNFQGIDAAIAATGMSVVSVSSGYVEVASNTIYLVPADTEGKVFFQTPAVMPVGFRFVIEGAGGAPVSRWNLSTQLNQSLINGADITNLGPDRYAILEPSSTTDRVSFICRTANTDLAVEFSSSAGLTIYTQLQVERNLYSVTAGTRVALYAMGQVDSAYAGRLLRVQRDSDSATAYVLPDLAYRASPLSPLDIGGNLATWMYGANISIIESFDQSGNAANLTGTALWIDAAGNVQSMTSTNNAAMQFFGAQSLQGSLPGNYANANLNVFALSQITNPTDSSILTLYLPAAGDDSSSALNCIAFRIPPALTPMETYRNGTLSTVALPATNTRLLLATRFDGANNQLTINGVAGSSVASTGNFGFSTVLLSARYLSGAISNQGYFKTACVFIYDSMSGADYAAVQAWIDTNF